MVGEFKDDCLQDHNHYLFNQNPTGSSAWVLMNDVGFYGNVSTGNVNGRFSTVTRGKRKGVKYIIKVL